MRGPVTEAIPKTRPNMAVDVLALVRTERERERRGCFTYIGTWVAYEEGSWE